MKQLFISYSRKDNEFTRQLVDRFEKEGLDAWIDWQDIPPSIDWMKEIQKGIEDADVFLYLVSPDSISSAVCAKELEHASLNGKRIIPVIVRDIDSKSAPAGISHLNWIFFSRPQDTFDGSFAKVWTAIHTDYDWVQAHRRLQVRALEWDRNQGEESFLFRGKDLQDAEAQLLVHREKNPLPTELQERFVQQSRTSENARLEEERAKEQQLALEKSTGTRLRRLTFAMLAIFTIAFVLLYFWLFTLVTNLSSTALKNQMITLVESSAVAIDGAQFHELVGEYSGDSSEAYQDSYFLALEAYLTEIKKSNTSTDPNMSIYVLTSGLKQGEIMVVASADREYSFKQPFTLNNSSYSQVAGLQKTTADLITDKKGFNEKVSACTPIRDSQSRSMGALCTDFHASIVTDARAAVARTLGIAFVSVYPAMVVIVLAATRSLSNFSSRFKKKRIEKG